MSVDEFFDDLYDNTVGQGVEAAKYVGSQAKAGWEYISGGGSDDTPQAVTDYQNQVNSVRGDAYSRLAALRPNDQDFIIRDREAFANAYDQRRQQYGRQEQTSLANALAARQGQQQAAGMLAARAAGRGPSVAALQGQQAVAQAGQGANAAAAGGRGPGGMALAQRLAMANGGAAASDAAMQAASGRNREVGQSNAALGQALAQMRQGDIGESGQSASAADAYINAAARVRQEQATLVAAQKRAEIGDQLRRLGVAVQAGDTLNRMQQRQMEINNTNLGSVLSAGGAAFGAVTAYGDKHGWYDDPASKQNNRQPGAPPR